MAQEPYLKGTICEVKGTKLEVKILGQVKPKAKTKTKASASAPKQKGFIYEVEHLSKNKDDSKTKYASVEIQAKSMGLRK